MKAAVMTAIGKTELEIRDVPMPSVPEGWALVKTKAAGVCGTELHFLEGLLKSGKDDFILGHEIAGVIESVPDGHGFKAGDRVSIYNKMNCGCCVYCKEGHDSLCPNTMGAIGFSSNGGFAEYVTVPIGSLVALPDTVPFTHGAILACSGLTAVHTVRKANIKLLENVVINGVGGVGLIVGQVVKLSGARVIAIADTAEKGELAKKAFADEVIVTTDYSTVPDKLKALTDGRGVDVFIELVGTSATYTAGLKSLAKLGRFLIVGYTHDRVDVDPLAMVVGENVLHAVVAGSKKDLIDVLQLAATGKIEVMIQEELSLDNVNVAIDRLLKRTSLGRNVLVFK